MLLLAKLSLQAVARVKPLPPAMRLGLGNLVRPGNHAALLIATLSAGAMMMVSSLETGRITMRRWRRGCLTIHQQRSHRRLPGVASRADSLPSPAAFQERTDRLKTQIGLRLAAVDGVTLGRVGPWYAAGCSASGLIVDREVQRRTGAAAGSRVDFFVDNRRISATVARVAEDEHAYPVEIDCGALDRDNLFHQAVVRAAPGRLPEVDQAIRDRFPGLAVITAPEIETVIGGITRDTQRLAWMVACFSVTAGLGI